MKGYPICSIEASPRELTPATFEKSSWEKLEAVAIAEAKRCLGSFFCDACDLCILLCPDLCMTRDERGRIIIDYDHCKGCGVCAAICPKNAIEMMPEKGN
jgi:pyruvate ferredoxin oxidoreductase delta subunit